MGDGEDPTQLDRIEAKLDALLALAQAGAPPAEDEDEDTLREHAEVAGRLDDLSWMLDIDPGDLRVPDEDEQA